MKKYSELGDIEMNNAYTFTYVQINYQCGHSVIRRVLRHQAGAPERWSYDRCEPCTDQLERRYAVVREVQEEREESLPVFPTGEWPPKPREVQGEEVAI